MSIEDKKSPNFNKKNLGYINAKDALIIQALEMLVDRIGDLYHNISELKCYVDTDDFDDSIHIGLYDIEDTIKDLKKIVYGD